MSDEKALQKSSEQVAFAPSHETHVAMIPRNPTELGQVAAIIQAGGFAPKGMDKYAIAGAIAHGLEVGLAPMQSVQCIAVINGRPSIWGDGVIALVQASGLLEDWFDEWDEETQTASCTVKRLGRRPRTEVFSMEDAKRAGLAGRDTYRQYPQRMCRWRARSWAFRGEFADVMKGLAIREEVEDYIDVTPAPREASTASLHARLRAATAPGREPEAEPPEPVVDEPTGPGIALEATPATEPEPSREPEPQPEPDAEPTKDLLYQRCLALGTELGARRTGEIVNECGLEMADLRPGAAKAKLEKLAAALAKANHNDK